MNCKKCNTPVGEYDYNFYKGLCCDCFAEDARLSILDASIAQPVTSGHAKPSDAAAASSDAISGDSRGDLVMGVDHGGDGSTAVLAKIKSDGSINVVAEGPLKDMTAALKVKRTFKRKNLTRDQWIERAEKAETMVRELEVELAEEKNCSSIERRRSDVYRKELSVLKKRILIGIWSDGTIGVIVGIMIGYLFFAR